MSVPSDRPRPLRTIVVAIAALGIPFNGGLGALALAYGALRERLRWVRTPLDAPLWIFLLWSVISAAATARGGQVFAGFVLALLVGIYVVYQVPYRWFRESPELLATLSRWAWPALPAAALVGLLSYLYVPNPDLGGFHRFALLRGIPAPYAWGLEVAMLLSLGALDRRQAPVLLSLAAGTFALIGTLSRWALLGFGVGLLVWGLLTARRAPRTVAAAIGTVALAAVVTLSLPMTRAIVRQYADELPGSGPARTLVAAFTPDLGFPERLVIWRTTLRIIRDHPWVGVGVRAYPSVYRRYLDPGAASIKVLETPAHLYAHNAHNDVLQIAVTRGLPAALACVALLLVALARALSRPASVPAAAALSAAIVHGMFDAIWTHVLAIFAIFWMIVAAAIQRAGAPGS